MDKLNFKFTFLLMIVLFFFKLYLFFILFYDRISEKKKQKRTAISNEIKCEICEFYIKNSQISYVDIATHFNQLYNFKIIRSTISKILKNKER